MALIDHHVDRILAILSKPLDCENEPPTFVERTLFWRYFQRHEWMLEKLWESVQLYNEQVSLLEIMSKRKPPEAFILFPDRMPPAKFITRDKRKINRTIDMGYRKATDQMREIVRFFG